MTYIHGYRQLLVRSLMQVEVVVLDTIPNAVLDLVHNVNIYEPRMIFMRTDLPVVLELSRQISSSDQGEALKCIW